MKKLIISILLLIFIIQQNKAQTTSLDEIFGSKTEVYFKFNLQTNEVMLNLTKIISIDNLKGQEVIAVANKRQFELFLEYNIDYEVLLSPSEMLPPEAWVMTNSYSDKSNRNWNAYPTYQAYLDLMVQFKNDYPNLCTLDTIGYTVNGKIILAAKLSNNVNTVSNKPEFLYTSTMHGDETVGYVLLLRLTDYLLSNYGTDTRVTNILNNITLYINPLANPDGTYFGSNLSVAGAIRNNANNYDLNRNFPSPDGNMYPGGQRQIETQYFMDWAYQRNFVMAANFHGGIELMNYPWDYTLTDNADKNWWIYVSKEYADSAQANSPAGYFVDAPAGADYPGVIEGSTWYIVDGSRQDFMNYFANCREVTVEISTTKNPPASTLTNFWNYNKISLLNYIEQVQYGFRGTVIDSCLNIPIKAKIELVNHDNNNSHVYTALPFGNYFRPAKAGIYSIKASAPGYQSMIIPNQSINDKAVVVNNFVLKPMLPIIDFNVDNVFSCTGLVSFIDNSSASNDAVYFWDFGDGNTSNQKNPTHIYQNSGLYDVKLKISNCIGSDSLIKNSFVNVSLVDAPQVANQSRCGSGSFTFNAVSNFNVAWWDSTKTQILHSGSTFATPILNEPHTYYVSAYTSSLDTVNCNPKNKTNTGTYFTGTSPHGLIFNANKDVVIKSVKVYSNSAANRTINLLDSNQNIVQTLTVNIPNGESRVNLNFSVSKGNNYRLMGAASPSLWRDGGISAPNLNFPFNTPDNEVSIIGNTAGSLAYYYYFYDWEVEVQTICESNKIPVQAEIHLNPVPNFNFYEISHTVNFINTSTGWGNYNWDFGDGNFSTEKNPEHYFAVPNQYSVTLTQTNDCGVESIQKSVIVTNLEENNQDDKLRIYPNPTNDFLYVLSTTEILTIAIKDINGREVKNFTADKKEAKIDVSSLPKGFYFIEVRDSNSIKIGKFVVN